MKITDHDMMQRWSNPPQTDRHPRQDQGDDGGEAFEDDSVDVDDFMEVLELLEQCLTHMEQLQVNPSVVLTDTTRVAMTRLQRDVSDCLSRFLVDGQS